MFSMHYRDYEITNYSDEFLTQAADLQQYLWPSYKDKNKSYLKWKYEDNPLTNKPSAIIALYKGKVVGFNGYFVTRWRVANKNDKILILSSADICVHPAHRRKGLFTAMTRAAIEEYEKGPYKAFLGLSSNTSSGRGYEKMGWPRIADRTSVRRYYLTGLLNWTFINKVGKSIYKHHINFGKFGEFEVSDKPRAKEMYSIIKKQKLYDNKIALFKDEKFFKWRFQNNRRKYTFYYHWNNETIDGYVVIETSDNSTSGHIVDYAEAEDMVLYKILSYVIKKRHFDILSTWSFGLRDDFAKTLKSLHFSSNNLLSKIEKTFRSEFPSLPVFVRPVKKQYTEEDWFIEGLDIRDINNWEINGICSDNT
jgi:GNAT superfamily N-acetyltransferase